MGNILTLSAFKGKPLPSVEILNGKRMQGRPGYEKTLLLGKCIVRANEDNADINDAICVNGCPPQEEDVVAAMKSVGLVVNRSVYHDYMRKQSEKYDGKELYDKGFFKV
jgi:hypothetical protein